MMRTPLALKRSSGVCDVLDPAQAAELPHLRAINFQAPSEIWGQTVRETWQDLDGTQRRELLASVRKLEDEVKAPAIEGKPDNTEKRDDVRAAGLLEDILGPLEGCEYIPVALSEWRERAAELLSDGQAANTVFLFDRDFNGENEGVEDEGLRLVREAQNSTVGYCGLITHTVSSEAEYAAWKELVTEHNLVGDKFVVISKDRLTRDVPDYYGFLGMLRLVALSGRYADVKSAAWQAFEKSITEARNRVECLSVLDFDRIVFESSRRESVWEPDTLFRVFSILMRREARVRLYEDPNVLETFAEARRVSSMPEEIASALYDENVSTEALRIHRFETYESGETLNQYHVPIELGDIFEKVSTGSRFILLVQPCDLVVRDGGNRNYEDKKLARMGAFVQLVVDPERDNAKESCVELPFYHESTGRSAFADFAKVHQVRLAVLDLCAFRADGVAMIEVDTPCPEILTEPWKEQHTQLQRLFKAALSQYQTLEKKQLSSELKTLALPLPSTTVRFSAAVEGKTVRYDLKRVVRLQQPRAGALLTAFNQYHARAAFASRFDHRIPMQNDDQEHDQDEETRAKK